MIIHQPHSPGELQDAAPEFNLLHDPWIDVLRLDGSPDCLSISDCLLQANELAEIADPSPLVIASLQRFLIAVAQDIGRPGDLRDLTDLYQQGAFDTAPVRRFEAEYGDRFELFSAERPFMQTGDLGLQPQKGITTKSVGYLFPEEPTGTNINHFTHRFETDYQFSPATAAKGLVTQPAFATSGGAGIRPSINGVPPIYVLPIGGTLFETLVLSMATPEFQPLVADPDDRPDWRRDPVVRKSHEVTRVGYLESLTFLARRVRLFPELVGGIDARSGKWSEVLVRRMVFEMGHYRAKDAEPWRDPFAAYRERDEGPVPARPVEGKTLWREYATLFQTVAAQSSEDATSTGKTWSPLIVQQIARLQASGALPDVLRPFRCIGIRTDMKAKLFEWVDETLDVPSGLLEDPIGVLDIEDAIQVAEVCVSRIRSIHRMVFGSGRDQYQSIRNRMVANFWVLLARPFRDFAQEAADLDDRDQAFNAWLNQVLRVGDESLRSAVEESGDRGDALRQRAEVYGRYAAAKRKLREEWTR